MSWKGNLTKDSACTERAVGTLFFGYSRVVSHCLSLMHSMCTAVNPVTQRCIVIFPICSAIIPQNRRSLPASQFMCAWMMSFEDHLLPALVDSSPTAIPAIPTRVNWPLSSSIRGQLAGRRGCPSHQAVGRIFYELLIGSSAAACMKLDCIQKTGTRVHN